MKYIDENGLAYLWAKIQKAIEDAGGSSGGLTEEQVRALINEALGEVINGQY